MTEKDKTPNSVFSVFVCLLIFVWIPSALKITRMAFGDTDVDVCVQRLHCKSSSTADRGK